MGGSIARSVREIKGDLGSVVAPSLIMRLCQLLTSRASCRFHPQPPWIRPWHSAFKALPWCSSTAPSTLTTR